LRGRLRNHLSAQQWLHEIIGEATLQEPRQRNRRDEVLRLVAVINYLMRNRRPKRIEMPSLDPHLAATQQISEPAGAEKIQFDLVVMVRAAHGRRIPAHAGQAIGGEIRPIGVK
jgi:hypothetical protein